MSIEQSDVQTYRKGRPYVEGIIALIFHLRWGHEWAVLDQKQKIKKSFDEAKDFLTEFEDRSQIK
jgi:hypothetical protein